MGDEQVRAFLTPFTSQSRITHLAAVLLGAGVFGGVYLSVLGDPTLAAASSPEALAARQTAIQVAGVAVGIYFALAYTRAIGGPGLNILYPLVAMGILPLLIALAYGGLPTHLYTSADFIFSARFTTDSLTVGLPGMLAFIVVFLGWVFLGLGTREAVDEWMAEHTTDAYREQIVNDDS